jgi:hypothetical protein
MTRGICLLTFFIKGCGGFSCMGVELGAWLVRGRFGVLAAWRPSGCGPAFLFLKAAAVLVCVPDKMPRRGYTPRSPPSRMA